MAHARPGMIVGADLGGTKIETAVVDPDGRVVSSHRLPTPTDGGPGQVVDDVVRCILACVGDSAAIGAVGVGVAGQVDAATGRVHSAPNLKWKDFPLGERLQEALGVPVVVENDVRAITWGEWRHGNGRGVDDLVVLFIGTGIGGGIVSGGHLLTGDRGMAGELGHMTVVADGRRCTCGNRGCIEAYAGGWAIAERAREAIEADPEAGSGLLERAGDGHVTAKVVTEAAADGDPLAAALLAETGRYLAAAVVGLVHVFNPRVILLGGGIIEGNPGLVDAVESAIRGHAIPIAAERLEVRRSNLGARAGVIGMAWLARRSIGG